jgi:hypothetical protein
MSLDGDSCARVLFLPLVVALAVVSCGARTDLAVGVPQLDAGEDVAMGEDSGCGGGATARVVATFGTGDLAPDVFTFSVAEGFAFVETGVSGNPLAIVRAPLGGGAVVTAVAGQPPGCGTASMSPFGYESPLATDGTTLYMASLDFSATGQGSSPTVTSYDVSTNALGVVPPPAGTASLNVSALRATPAPGVYYLTGSEFDPSTSDLVHWDGVTSTVVATPPEWCYDLQIVGETIFLLGAHALYQMPLAGGPIVVDTPVTFATGAGLLGANSTAVFYTTDHVHVVRRTPAGATLTLASALENGYGIAWADEIYLYFSGPAGLLRVGVLGGAVETFWPSPRSIKAVTTVGCHVYWLADTDFANNIAPQLFVAPE